jgi:hypothetical protein
VVRASVAVLGDVTSDTGPFRPRVETAPSALAGAFRATLAASETTEAGYLVTGFVNGTRELLLLSDGKRAAESLDEAVRSALDRQGPLSFARATGAV